MRLEAQQFDRLLKALIGAFDGEALERMVRLGLGVRLEEIADGGALPDRVCKLIEWAEMQDMLRDLVWAAREANEGNAELRACADALRQAGAMQPAPHADNRDEPMPIPQQTGPAPGRDYWQRVEAMLDEVQRAVSQLSRDVAVLQSQMGDVQKRLDMLPKAPNGSNSWQTLLLGSSGLILTLLVVVVIFLLTKGG